MGFRNDKQLIIWRWQDGESLTQISTQRIGNKVRSISFSVRGDFFVTAGDKHLKVIELNVNPIVIIEKSEL